ncbi:fibrillin-1 [Exaiptasia diaphana]|uniref:Uncharacterized protein n=1 Tax=Exaiptasia diaphana TaxID=2652724 RepID=A0A913YLU2_EXADI|nr:fibrillin-1 [Exaiptasia diaphana]
MVYGPSEKECGKGCTRNSTCFSFNFGTKPVFHIGDEPQYLCELLPTDKYNSSQLFAPSADFHHYSIQTECKSSPCPKDCQCVPNYLMGNYICLDNVDECEAMIHNCHSLASCTNTMGSYYCTCLKGLTGNGFKCGDINECATDQHNCTAANAICENKFRSHTCRCAVGFQGDGVNKCVELDECLNPSSCNNNSRCFNTIGSYVCDCLPGYKKESGNCVDIDECATGSHSCHSSATCTNNHGSYSCACNDNFAGDGRKCTKTIIVSVTSGDPVEFKINEVKVSNEKAEHGINILVLNMNGTVHVPVKGFDTLHEKHGISAAQQTTLLYKLISSIPNNKIVLMGLFKSDHMPKQPTFDDLKTQFQAIGSNVKLHSEIVGKSGWSLIGYKGGQKPWMKESFDTNSLIATINPLE